MREYFMTRAFIADKVPEILILPDHGENKTCRL